MKKTAKTLRGWLHEDAVLWGIPSRGVEVILLLPIVGGLVVALMRLESDFYFWFLDEDSIVEWSQFGLFLVAAVLAALAAQAFRTTGRGFEAVAFLVFVLGCILVAGEEISWGQRILGLETPDRLAEVNVQGEFSAHNILEIRLVLKFAMIGVGLYGFAVPWLVRMGLLPLGPRLGLAVPPLFLTSCFLVLAAYNIGRLVFFPSGFWGVEQNYTLGRFGEWPEFCLSFAFAAYTFLVWRRLQTKPQCDQREVLAAAAVHPPSPRPQDGLAHGLDDGPAEFDELVAAEDGVKDAQRDSADVFRA